MRLSKEAWLILLGVDIGGTKTSVCVGRKDGTVIAKEKFPTQGGAPQVIRKIEEAGLNLLAGKKPEAIGISCGNPLDASRGLILSPPHLPGWDKVPVVRLLRSFFDTPAFLMCDANAGALAEWKWGAGRGARNMIFLTFGTGFGAGLILDGRLYEGTNGYAGEIGHVRLEEDGPECYGKRGCVESFCSGAGIALLAREKYGMETSTKDICLAAEKGDPAALEIIRISAEHLGRTLAILVDLFNPEVIVLGSIYVRAGALFRKTMERVLEKEALPGPLGACSVRAAALDEKIGDMAALAIALDGLEKRKKA